MMQIIIKWHFFTLWALVVLLFTASACTSEPTDLSVRVCGDFSVPDDLDALRITLLDDDRNELRSSVLPLLECPQDEIRPLPQSTTFRNADPNTRLVLIAGLREEVVVARTERRIEELGDLLVSLTESCRGSQCTLGQACINGSCEWTPTGSDTDCTASPDNDEFDAGLADEEDASFTDAGEDAGVPSEQPRYCPADDA